MEIVSFILGGSAIAAILVSVVKWLIKKCTGTDTKTLGALVILFVVSLILSVVEYGFNNLLDPEVQLTLGMLFTTAIAIFDVFKKGLFDGAIVKAFNKFC